MYLPDIVYCVSCVVGFGVMSVTSVVNAMSGEYESVRICAICGQERGRKSSLLLQGSVYRAVSKRYKKY